jgi:tetrahydromethanopterin S-methyltransferase subunit G
MTKENGKHARIDLALQRLSLTFEAHTKMDDEHFNDIKARLSSIETKLDKWTLKVTGISAVMGLIVSLLFFVLTKIGGG